MLRASRPLIFYRDLFRHMRVDLKAIHFNYDPNPERTGAFTIRRNERCDIVLPEWRRGISVRPEDAPAAYVYNLVKDIRVTIEAEFSCDDPDATVLVRARDGHLKWDANCESNVLGTVAETEVTFVKGGARAA